MKYAKVKSMWILTAFWLVFVFFINASFECNLRAYLMRTDFEKSVETMDDVLTMNKELHIPPGTIVMTLFSNSPIPVQQVHYAVSSPIFILTVSFNFRKYSRGHKKKTCSTKLIDREYIRPRYFKR